MEFIVENSETRFVEWLPAIEQSPQAWIYVHIKLASLHAAMCLREGVSSKSLDKFRTVSLQIAHRLPFKELDPSRNKAFVFEDGDIMAMVAKASPNLETLIEKLKVEFSNSEFGKLLEIDEMQFKLASLMSFFEEKKQNAAEYRNTKNAIRVADSILTAVTPDPERAAHIQAKRIHRGETHILVVEDDILARGLIASALKNSHKIIHAKNAHEGIAAFIQHAPDVVFLDIHLPDLDGHEVLRRLTCLDSQAYVVMLSADSVKDNIILSHERGAAGFIKKPFTREKLQEYIEKCPTITAEGKAVLKTKAEIGIKANNLGWNQASVFTKEVK